jgi:hypothetical protein
MPLKITHTITNVRSFLKRLLQYLPPNANHNFEKTCLYWTEVAYAPKHGLRHGQGLHVGLRWSTPVVHPFLQLPATMPARLDFSTVINSGNCGCKVWKCIRVCSAFVGLKFDTRRKQLCWDHILNNFNTPFVIPQSSGHEIVACETYAVAVT